jgi:N-acetylneuraminic acid mutarotase
MQSHLRCRVVSSRCIKACVAVSVLFALPFYRPVYNALAGQSVDTSTEWRNDEANKLVVQELNKAYAYVPFSQEYEGMLDKSPFEVSWNTGPNLPVTWKGGIAGIIGQEIVLIGGLWMPGYRNLAYSYNLDTKTYKEIPPPPFKTEYTQGACDGTNVYIVGGRVAGRHVAKLSRPNANDWQWSDLPSLPESEANGRWLANVEIAGKWLLFVSGHPTGTPSEERGRPAMKDWRLRLDDPKAQWQPMKPYPGSVRAMLESAVVRGKLYVFGGSHPNPAMRESFKKLVDDYRLFNVPYAGVPEYRDSYFYEPEKNEWKRIKNLPFPMHGAKGVALQDRYILLMGTSENKSLRVGKTDVSVLAGTATKNNSTEHTLMPYWQGYNDLILCYDVEYNNYSRVGVMMYGVATCPWVTDGQNLYGFGGEPCRGFNNNNTENVLQIGSIKLRK